MKIQWHVVAIVVSLFLLSCSKAPEAPSAAAVSRVETVAAVPPGAAQPAARTEHAIAWEAGDVDAAFAKAKAEDRPLFLYWGAVWCPPCNEVKATIFSRQDFIERSRNFVPVYIDGDAKSAQKLGARFNVSGYPTMILFTPDGREITRLPGEIEPNRYMQVLSLGMNGARPVKETLDMALAKGDSRGKLRPEDWRMLAWYSWETDESQVLDASKRPAALQRLANACPADQPQLATRLSLQALVARAKAKDARPRDDKSAVDMLLKVLADPAAARENFDLVVYYADNMAGNVTQPRSAARARLVDAWNATLVRLAADPGLSEQDRLTTLYAQVELAKLDSPKGPAPDALLRRIRDEVARADQETRDPYSRQAVISAAAELLTESGLLAESDALLTAELARSHSPYYFMLGLADNAKRARRQGGRGRLGREGLRRVDRTRDAAAMGVALRRAAGRTDAAGRDAHREGRGAGHRRTRARSRYVLRAQSARAGAGGEESREMEQGQPPRRRSAAALRRNGGRVRQAAGQ